MDPAKTGVNCFSRFCLKTLCYLVLIWYTYNTKYYILEETYGILREKNQEERAGLPDDLRRGLQQRIPFREAEITSSRWDTSTS
jgi:hypothetical protein